MRLKVLLLQAAMNLGYVRASSQTLPAFVKTLPSNSFGTEHWQIKLLDNYKKLILTDPTLLAVANLPSRRVSAMEIALAVQPIARSEQFAWLRDIYRLVFGLFPEDAASRTSATIQT